MGARYPEKNDSEAARVRSDIVRARFVVACLVALTVRADAKRWPSPAAGVTMTGDPELILTFDDGPHPTLTPQVLDILAAHHIKAVFFVVGWRSVRKEAPAIFDRMLREGHIIANHTMNHRDLCRLEDPLESAREIDDGLASIEKASGWHPIWFRTPYGVRCELLDSLLAERHITHFHWDLDPQEWRKGSKKKTVAYLTKVLGKMTGRNVLLMHDTKRTTVEVLPEILDFIEAENARRKELRMRRIRVIQSWEIAVEQMPPGMLEWMEALVPSRHRIASVIASVLP